MHTDRRITPRWLRLVGLLLLPALLLAACGGDDDNNGAAGDVADTEDGDAAVDPDGVLRLGFDLTSLKMDPILANAPTEFYIHYMMFDTLLRQKEDGTYEPGLARSADIQDPSTLKVTLKPGRTFQDGTPVDAAAVKFTIDRNVAANAGRAFRVAELSQIASVEVVSPTELTIKLKTPIAGSFYNLLAHNETMPISPAAAAAGKNFDAAPVGAGPFRFESFNASDRLKLVKWDDYPEADDIRLAGVDIVHVTAQSGLNALRSKTIDAITISQDQVPQVGGVAKTRTKSSPDSVLWVSLQCEAFPQLADVRVRKALNFATDKDELNQQLYDGEAEPMSQFWTKESKYYNKDIADAYDYDVEKAKKLLAEAGVPNLELSMATTAGAPIIGQVPEILQQQWSKAGIKLEIVATQNSVTDYYVGKKMASIPTPQTRFWTDKITRNFVPGSVGNTCDPKDPAFTTLVQELRGLEPASDEAIELWQEISEYLSDNALGVWGLMTTVSNAWLDERVGNITWRANQVGNLIPDARHVFIKK